MNNQTDSMSPHEHDPERAGISRRQALIVGAATLVSTAAATLALSRGTDPTPGRVTIDLDREIADIDPTYCGIAHSTFGRPPTDPDQGLAERTLDARYIRIPVRWTGTAIVSSAEGAQGAPVESSIRTYYSWPGVRMLLIIAGRDGDWAGYVPGDAEWIARRLAALGMTDLSRFDFSGPNEPDQQGISMSAAAQRCAQISDELRSAGTDGLVWGPVWSNAADDFAPFALATGAERLAGVDWHFYPGGTGEREFTVREVLDRVAAYGATVDRVRQLLIDNGFHPNVSIDELNWSWQQGHSTAVFTAANTVMIALALCTTLSHGGRCVVYASQNGELSVMVDADANPDGRPLSSPMPAYWGIAALTGANVPGAAPLFPHFRSTFYATSSSRDRLKVFAMDNETDGRTIILINIDESEQIEVDLTIAGFTGSTFDLFQTRRAAPYSPPARIVIGSTLPDPVRLSCPPMTVTVLSLRH